MHAARREVVQAKDHVLSVQPYLYASKTGEGVVPATEDWGLVPKPQASAGMGPGAARVYETLSTAWRSGDEHLVDNFSRNRTPARVAPLSLV